MSEDKHCAEKGQENAITLVGDVSYVRYSYHNGQGLQEPGWREKATEVLRD